MNLRRSGDAQVRKPTAYRNARQRFKLRTIPGRTHRLRRIEVHYNGETRTIGEWSLRLGRKPHAIWLDLKRGLPLEDVLGGALDRGRGDWLVLRAKVRKLGL